MSVTTDVEVPVNTSKKTVQSLAVASALLALSIFVLSCTSKPAAAQKEAAPLPEITLAVPTPAGAPAPFDRTEGWADYRKYTTGGAAATAENTYTVTNKAEFVAALNKASSTAKIIYVQGMIDLCVDGNGKSLGAMDFLQMAGIKDYATYEDYQKAYIAACSASSASTLEPARNAAYNKQKDVVVLRIGSNTSIIGIGADSGFKNGMLFIDGVTNVVLRNLNIVDAFDYFPSWDPSDGYINSEYDNVSISNSTYVWVDHCLLSDGERPDSTLPTFQIPGLGNTKTWMAHDGLIDVVRGSQYVTVSWNILKDHDKSMLFGNSDTSATDPGKLQITVHNNHFINLGQRLPRVRFGQVHVYNNFYESPKGYCIAVGASSRIHSEANIFPRPIVSFQRQDKKSPGYIFDMNSINFNTEKMDTAQQVGWTPSAMYAYTVKTPEEAQKAIVAGAGPGKF
jgi:pectate lyase